MLQTVRPPGILTVNAHFTDADIKNIENDEQVTVLALQVSKGDNCCYF